MFYSGREKRVKNYFTHNHFQIHTQIHVNFTHNHFQIYTQTTQILHIDNLQVRIYMEQGREG